MEAKKCRLSVRDSLKLYLMREISAPKNVDKIQSVSHERNAFAGEYSLAKAPIQLPTVHSSQIYANKVFARAERMVI